MTKVTKEVKFYDTVVEYAASETKPGRVKTVKPDFWPKLLTKLEALPDAKARTGRIGERQYYGAVLRPTSPAINHLQVGRIRDLSEHIEETDLDSGAVAPLILSGNRRVSEPTFVIPFFASGRVAIMSPGRSTRHETIATWLTLTLGLAAKGKSIRFRPVIDENALQRLIDSKGAVGVEFALEADRELPSGEGLPLLDAVESVRAGGPSVGTFYVGWSLGRGNHTTSDKNLIKRIAERMTSENLARRASVNMIVEDAHGKLRHETHNMFEDQVVQKASWQVSPNQKSDSSAVLSAISNAIQNFNSTPSV